MTPWASSSSSSSGGSSHAFTRVGVTPRSSSSSPNRAGWQLSWLSTVTILILRPRRQRCQSGASRLVGHPPKEGEKVAVEIESCELPGTKVGFLDPTLGHRMENFGPAELGV